MRGKSIKIIVAAHRKYRMPDGTIYLPVQVGAAGKEPLGYQPDNTGEHISEKNPCYCELTGLYWAWKNLDCAYLGLAHYRRHFSRKKKGDAWASVLTDTEAQVLCSSYDIILPRKRRYYIETLYSHYAHTHYAEHLDILREIIAERCPAYRSAYDAVLRQTSGYMFNMFLMRRDLADDYCAFLFDLLFALEKRVDPAALSAFQARYLGRVSEILFNVWLRYQQEKTPSLKVIEIGCVHMEKINWWKKGSAFLKAKFFGTRYEHGF